METVRLTRRHFAATLAGAMAWAKSNWPDRLGIMCQLGDSEKSARPALAAAAQAGFRRIQATFSWDKVTPAFLRDLPGWIRTEGLQCEALGAYVNCLNPDIILMNTGRKDFGRAIEYASAVGATCLVAWTGSFSTDLMKEDSRNRDSQVANQIARFLNTYWKAIDDARLHLALETYITLACPDAASLAALLDTLPAAAGAVLDPPNLTPPARYADRDQVLKEMVQLLGQRTKIVHLKDFKIRPGGQAYDLPGPLQGEMNYKLFAALLETIPAGVPVIAEHLAPAEFASARQRLLAVL